MTVIAFSMDTSVYSMGGSVNNLGLLQKQMMVLHTGLAAFVAGTVLLVGSIAVETGASTATGPRTAASSDETLEEREERLVGVKRLNRIIGLSLLGLVLLLVIVGLANA